MLAARCRGGARGWRSRLLLAALAGALSGAAAEATAETAVPAVRAPVPPSPAAPAPGGTVEVKERSFDAGKVDQGAVVTHTFTLRNVGKHDLTVEVDASCGCTVVEFDRVIAPGREGKVTASVKTEHFRGLLEKEVDVTTNDPENPHFELTIQAVVLVPIEVEPDAVQISARAGERARGATTLRASDGRPFDVQALTPMHGVKVSVAPIGAGGEPGAAREVPPAGAARPIATGASAYRLDFELEPSPTVGRSVQAVTVATSHPKAPTLSVYVNVAVRGEVEVLPDRVFLHAVATPAEGAEGHGAPVARPVSMVVKLRKAEGAPLEIKGVTSSDPAITTSLQPVVPGREIDLTVTYSGDPSRGIVSGRIQVATSVAAQPTIDIPVFAKPVGVAPRAASPPAAAGAAAPGATGSPVAERARAAGAR